ncbi:MAG: hypothetical protein GF401_18205 [Chitinivibrionales bacterium]|nr:hypothetical protein [Chitinivibrionales bacterium]
MKKKQQNTQKKEVVIRFRHVLAAITLVAASVLLPLFIVWKQVYITEASMKSKVYADSLVVLKQETERLRLTCENLVQSERIEKIAVNHLDLHYPPSNRITIIEPEGTPPKKSFMGGWEFFALIRKSLSQDKG